MVINNRLFKFSSLCIIGAVTFCCDRFVPKNSADASEADIANIYAQECTTKDELGSDSVIGIDIDALSNKETQNDIEKKTEEKQEKKIKALLPDIPGLKGSEFNIEDFKGLAIVQVEKYINIKKEPGNGSKSIVGTISNNAGCFVVKQVKVDGKYWTLIKSGGIIGYVPSSCLITGNEALELMTHVGKYVINVTCDDNLNVRSSPSNASGKNIVDSISKGEKLEVLSVNNGWVEVLSEVSGGDEDNTESAYVSADYVVIKFELKTAQSLEDIAGIGTNQERHNILKFADQHRGLKYVWGGTSLTTGADCSGFVQAVFGHFHISLPRVAADQAKCGRSVSESELKPGDLVFYKSGSRVKHVGIYAGVMGGKKKIIHSPHTGDVVKYTNMEYSKNRFYRRILDKEQ